MARIAVLQHFWCENEGVFGQALRDDGHECIRVPLYDGVPVPPADDYDGWLIMGGPMNVDDVEEYPFLSPERELIRTLIERDAPVLGICLGSQLIARAVGSRVYPQRPKEIGLFDIEMTEAARQDPLFQLLGERYEVLQWHGDTFDLPDGAVLLARSDRFRHQAFRLGTRVYGLQFHLECTEAIRCNLEKECASELAELSEEDRYDRYAERLPAALVQQNRLAKKLMRAWGRMM